MVDNFEYGNFENLTLRLRHKPVSVLGTGIGNWSKHTLKDPNKRLGSAPGRVRDGDECPQQG